MKFHSEIKNSIKNAKKFKGILFVNIISYLLLTIAIRKGHSKEILKFKWLILLFGGSVAKYFVARASFLNGDYIFAKKLYQEIIKVNPIHTDSYYGLADVYRLTGNKLEAKDVLIQVFNFSDCLKTWLLLANLVDTKKDYDELLNHWERECSYRNILKYHYDVNDYLIIAALRAKLYEEALNQFLRDEKLESVPVIWQMAGRYHHRRITREFRKHRRHEHGWCRCQTTVIGRDTVRAHAVHQSLHQTFARHTRIPSHSYLYISRSFIYLIAEPYDKSSAYIGRLIRSKIRQFSGHPCYSYPSYIAAILQLSVIVHMIFSRHPIISLSVSRPRISNICESGHDYYTTTARRVKAVIFPGRRTAKNIRRKKEQS